jgi:hypothetical protein
MKPIIISCLGCLLLNLTGLAQSIIVDHNAVKDFDRIPDQYKVEAAKLRMLFMDRSVGGNIDSYLDCLASPWSSAKSYCKHYDHKDSAYAVNPLEVFWAGTWDRRNWRYEYWPATCSEDVNCFIDFIEPRIDSFDVMGCQFSYLAVTPGSKIADTINGFFGSKPGKNHAIVYSAFAAKYPVKKIIWWTTSLARGIGTPESQAFNQQSRDFANKNNIILFDVADILSHDPDGKPCYDNRDGITYMTENNPDDGLDIPAICPQYTTETEGGHLGSISAGGIRVAKAFWVLMARIAGWKDDVTQTSNTTREYFILFPNPVQDVLQIQFELNNNNEDFQLSIVDATGKTCFFDKFQSKDKIKSKTINLSGFDAGLYLLSVHTAKNVRNFKFVVSH